MEVWDHSYLTAIREALAAGAEKRVGQGEARAEEGLQCGGALVCGDQRHRHLLHPHQRELVVGVEFPVTRRHTTPVRAAPEEHTLQFGGDAGRRQTHTANAVAVDGRVRVQRQHGQIVLRRGGGGEDKKPSGNLGKQSNVDEGVLALALE